MVVVTVAVVGPTATGKSDLGVALARRLGGEVVNADALQLYRGMDVGTAKLTPAERAGVPHHQLDVLDVAEEASVARYQAEARADVVDILGRGARPVVVGGSGLYVRALLDRLDLPPTDPDVRARLEARVAAEGPGLLHDELARLDPVAAARIERADARRTVRALEVIEITGRPFSASLPEPEHLRPTLQIGLDCARDVLDARIEARVDRMWTDGLVEETRRLAPRMGPTASRAIGYAQVLDVLAGRTDDARARADVAAGTRRLARRQMTWFGRDLRVHWFDAGDPDVLERVLSLVAEADAGRAPATVGPRRRLHA